MTGKQCVEVGSNTQDSSGEKTDRARREHFTFNLSDTTQRVLEGVQRAGLVIVSLLSGQVKLQLFQSFNHLLLVLGFGRLLTTANCTK